MEPQPSGDLALFCRVRGRLCALTTTHLVETMRPLPITPLPGAPPFVRGLSVIRGAPIPVIDLGALLADAEPPETGRFVTLRLRDRRVALAVEAVVGVRELPARLDALPPLLGESVGGVTALAALDAELLLVLETAKLVPESVWQQLDARGTA